MIQLVVFFLFLLFFLTLKRLTHIDTEMSFMPFKIRLGFLVFISALKNSVMPGSAALIFFLGIILSDNEITFQDERILKRF